MSTAENIKVAREFKGLSQIKLAKRTKLLTQSQISKIEKGNRKITEKDLLVISKALGIEVGELLGTCI